MNMLKLTYHAKSSQDSTHLLELFYRGYQEFSELQDIPENTWVQNATRNIMRHSRMELTLHDGDNLVAGCVLIIDDTDFHVGNCLSVLSLYVLPEYRGTTATRELMSAVRTVAWFNEQRYIMFTRRVGVHKYSATYRRVHG